MNALLKKRLTKMGIALGVVFGGIILFNLFKAFMIKRFFANFEPPAVTISSVTAKTTPWEPRLSAVGNMVAINGVDVNSEASGNVVAIHFDSGQFIEKDAPLIVIDDEVDQAMLKANQADLTLQALNFERQENLFKRGATSNSSVDEAKAKKLQAQANVEKIEATIRQKHITAPFAGQLGIRQVNLGQYITPGQTAIVSLQSLDPLYLEFYLPEQLLGKIHIDQGITFAVEQYPNLLFQGKITAINSKVDVNTHNIQVQATIPNCPMQALEDPKHSTLVSLHKSPEHRRWIVSCDSKINEQNKMSGYSFIPGMFAAIEIEQPAIPDVIALPSTAISYSLYGDSVYVIEKEPTGKKDQDGKEILRVKRVFVQTGDQQGNYTRILKGVTAGQLIVSSGELKLQNGTRVEINNDVSLTDVPNPNSLGE